ncbi:MAG: WG repeat-containing protein [Clostridia bacterium]|nr:WG repeat-containing protein [Clostridia bacterium]
MSKLEVRQCLVQDGRVIVTCDEVTEQCGKFIVRIGNRSGLYDSDGNIVLPIMYESIRVSSDGFIFPVGSFGMGLCDASGEFIFRPDYDSVEVRDGHVVLYDGSLYALASLDGKVLLPFAYDHITVLVAPSFVALWRSRKCTVYFTKTDRVASIWGERFEFTDEHFTLYKDDQPFVYDAMGNQINMEVTTE